MSKERNLDKIMRSELGHSTGDCDHSGTYAPMINGKLDYERQKHFKKGDYFDEYDGNGNPIGNWIMIGSD